jgi:hypothetical protein
MHSIAFDFCIQSNSALLVVVLLVVNSHEECKHDDPEGQPLPVIIPSWCLYGSDRLPDSYKGQQCIVCYHAGVAQSSWCVNTEDFVGPWLAAVRQPAHCIC